MAITPEQRQAITNATQGALASGSNLFEAGTAARRAVPGLSERDYKSAVDAAYVSFRSAVREQAPTSPARPTEIVTAVRPGQINPVNYTVKYTYINRQGEQIEAYQTITGDGTETEQDVLDEAAQVAADDEDKYAQFAAGAFGFVGTAGGFEITAIYSQG